MSTNSYFDEFNSQFERPQVNGLIVGFSGIDPQRKFYDSGGGDNYTLSDEQLNSVRELIQNEFNNEQTSTLCNCDNSNLSDEQKNIVLQLLDARLKSIKIAYDGGLINEGYEPENDDDDHGYDENYDTPAEDSGDIYIDKNHEELSGLLGGNYKGHFHVTEEELLKLTDYPKFSDLKHERLPDLLGGNHEGHFHVTDEELSKLRILIHSLFPDGSNKIIITPATPEGNDNDSGDGDSGNEGYDGELFNGGLPSGNPPGWEIKLFPDGRSAHANTGKMYLGYLPSSKGYNGLFVRLDKNSLYCTSDLASWTKVTNAPSSMSNDDYNVPQYIQTNGGVLKDNSSQGFLVLNGDAKANPYLYYAYKKGNYYYHNSTSVGNSKATLVAGAYSELLQCIIAVDSTNHIVNKRTKGSTSMKKISSSQLVTANLGCAAWNPVTQVFCISGKEGTSTSSDGETWTINTDVPHNLKGLTFRDDLMRFFAWSGNDKLFYSSNDGINWDKVNSSPIPLDNITAVDWNNPNGWYCAVGYGDSYAYFSKNLNSWVQTKIRNNSNVDITDVVYMPSTGLYVAVPNSGSYYYTFNPSDWN